MFCEKCIALYAAADYAARRAGKAELHTAGHAHDRAARKVDAVADGTKSMKPKRKSKLHKPVPIASVATPEHPAIR